MALDPGATLGPYEVLSPLGAGGMGEVYRARDTRLGRDVAIKLLPAEVAQDPERLARFRREAHLLASLNHPHVAAVHGLEEVDGKLLLILELVEGEGLADRLNRGAIPVDEALEIARQIAEALEEAHERGIVHRDLKPANIKLTLGGKAKVLDFGLAKAYSAEGDKADVSHSPTLTRAGTDAGVILGTAAYMSPEQARGKPVDKRADIWAFGVVLFEMLTGARLFNGETTSDTLAAVLRNEPEWELLPDATPPLVRSLLRRCLQKDRDRRLHDIADARIELEEARAEPTAIGQPPSRPHGDRARWVTPAFVLVGVAIGALATRSLLSRPTAVPSRDWYAKRFNLALPPDVTIPDLADENNSLAVAPDGRRVVFGAAAGPPDLYVREVDKVTASRVVKDGSDPFFSPDGQWLGFSRKAQLWRQSIQGGEPSLICDAPWAMGASWGEDGTILFAPSNVGGLSVVSMGGAKPKSVVEPDPTKGEVSYRWPQLLPGGKEALFTAVATKGEKTIGLLSLETGRWRPLFKDGTHPRYAFGYLFFVRGTSLLATPFGPPWRDPEQPPITVLEDVWSDSITGFAYLEVSANGSLVYVPRRGDDAAARLVWVDRGGAVTPLSQKQLPYWTVALSPDATRLAATVRGREPGLWVSDLGRDIWSRLTDDRANGSAWTRDGQRLIYASGRSGSTNIFGIPANGGGAAEQLTFGAGWQIPDFVAQDGKTLVYETLTTTGWDLMSLTLAEPRQTQPFLASPSDERFAAISPNGRWVAYSSSESGEEAVYVRRFDKKGGKWRVAPSVGRAPVWGRDGRELFYRDGAKMMVVQVTEEPEFAAKSPRVLFEIATNWPFFDIAPDGRHFVMIMEADQAETMPPQLVIIPDWNEEVTVKMRQSGGAATSPAVR